MQWRLEFFERPLKLNISILISFPLWKLLLLLQLWVLVLCTLSGLNILLDFSLSVLEVKLFLSHCCLLKSVIDWVYFLVSALDRPRKEVLCRYFANNVCSKGADCPFSHDRSAKPNTVCKYYLVGSCAYGDRCRFGKLFLFCRLKLVFFKDNEISSCYEMKKCS